MNKTIRIVCYALLAAIAFPHISLLIILLMSLLITQGVLVTLTSTIAIFLLVLGAYTWLSPLMRVVSSVRRRWTHFIWELWKLNEQKRTIRHSENRVRTTVTDSTTDRTNLIGDDRA